MLSDKAPTRIAFCLFKYFPYGGLERDFLRIALACRERGHSLHVFTMQWEGAIPSGVNVTIIRTRSLTNHGRCKEFAQKVTRHLETGQFDVVVGFNKMPGLDIYFAGDPCFQARAYESRSFLYRLWGRYRSYTSLEREVFEPRAQTKILLLAENEMQKFIKFYKTPNSNFHHVPAGISPDRCAPKNSADIREELRKEYGLKETEHLLLMVGSDFKRKGVDRSLQAIAALPESIRQKTRLFVIGRGKARRFQRMSRGLGIAERVLFLGSRDDVSRFMLAADLLVHPAYSETAGMVLLEAMAAGLPVLVTENCGYSFHIERAAAGLLVPTPFDQDEFNQLLRETLISRQLPIWKQNGLDYVDRTDVFSLPEKAANLIESVARKGRAA